ncbi:MAG: trehalose-6-phosphate synthase [Candidatus Omnitrophota bacterium]
MRRILILILPILLIVAIGFTVFGVVQVRLEEERLLDDLKRKSKTVAESIELSVGHVLLTEDLKSANSLVEKFSRRERLQGCAIYDRAGQMLAVSSRFRDWKEKDKPYLAQVLAQKTPIGQIEKFKELSVYVFILPIFDEEGGLLGFVEVINDTSYVFSRLAELWRNISVTLILLLVSIFLVALFIQRQIFILPLQRLTRWFQHFQRGEIDNQPPIKDKGELGKLASEVEQVALSLRVARRVISDEAHVQIQKEDFWTEAKLRSLIHARLGDNALFVVSNREPYMHVMEDIGGVSGKPRCIRPASGVVTAIDPIMRACGGTWIAHGSGNADRRFVNSKNKLGVPPNDNRYILKRVWLTKEEEEGYYYGFANEGLWPLCHNTHTRPIFRKDNWEMYKKVNQKFVKAVLEEFPAQSPFVFIQDYHFTLLPKLIKDERPDATVALFWHIPWPTAESFSICPYRKEILEGMLGCDLIGFHVQNHCNNFLETANRLLESRVDTEKFSVVRKNKETFVRSFPISIDIVSEQKSTEAEAEQKEIARIKREFDLEGKIIGVGVDRIDYTKGLIERVLAIDRFLEKYPQYQKKVVFLQLAAPSRTHIKRYHDLTNEIDELVEKKNWKYSDGDWRPIIYLKRYFSQDEIQPYYRMADFCIVSSLHDGMNLVSKEYVAAKKNAGGALVLSTFTGASRELTDAILINPYSIEEFADGIKAAVEMPPEEQERRMENMRQVINENNVYRWAANIISELTALKKM